MSFKNYLLYELFKSKSKYKYHKNDSAEIFTFDVNNNQYTVYMDDTYLKNSGLRKIYDISFEMNNEGGKGFTGISGKGESIKVFSNVVSIINEWLKKKKPDGIVFSASLSEPSRVRLYRSLSNRMNNTTEYHFNEKLQDHVSEIMMDDELEFFVLSKGKVYDEFNEIWL